MAAKRVYLARWAREWLAEWPAGVTRELGMIHWMRYGDEGNVRKVYMTQFVEHGYVVAGTRSQYKRTKKAVRLRTPRIYSAGPSPIWPWPIPYHVQLIRNSPFASHVRWLESLGQLNVLDDAIIRPQLRLGWSRYTRTRIVRKWLEQAGEAYTPLWLEKYSGPRHVAIWCAILQVRPVKRTDTGWRFEAIKPETAKQQLLKLQQGTIDSALQRLVRK